MELTGKQKRFLRGLAHDLSPVVQVGKDGVTDGLHAAVNTALTDHELIKVKILESSPVERAEVATLLSEACQAAHVGTVGRIVMLYRRHPTKPDIELPGALTRGK